MLVFDIYFHHSSASILISLMTKHLIYLFFKNNIFKLYIGSSLQLPMFITKIRKSVNNKRYKIYKL